MPTVGPSRRCPRPAPRSWNDSANRDSTPSASTDGRARFAISWNERGTEIGPGSGSGGSEGHAAAETKKIEKAAQPAASRLRIRRPRVVERARARVRGDAGRGGQAKRGT